MISAIKLAIVNVLKSLIVSMFTEKALKIVVVGGLEKLAKSTDNKVDDEVVAEIKRNLR